MKYAVDCAQEVVAAPECTKVGKLGMIRRELTATDNIGGSSVLEWSWTSSTSTQDHPRLELHNVSRSNHDAPGKQCKRQSRRVWRQGNVTKSLSVSEPRPKLKPPSTSDRRWCRRWRIAPTTSALMLGRCAHDRMSGSCGEVRGPAMINVLTWGVRRGNASRKMSSGLKLLCLSAGPSPMTSVR